MPKHILDSQGNRIEKGSIATVIDGAGNTWEGCQALIMNPDSDIEGDGVSVAVIFFSENAGQRRPGGHNVCGDCKGREKSCELFLPLASHDMLRACPRVWFFSPKELRVDLCWKIGNLAVRVCGHQAKYAFPDIPDNERPDSGLRNDIPCQIADCTKMATCITFITVWGATTFLFTCPHHHQKWHGKWPEELPGLKEKESHVPAPQ
jgi:hypothetical protein